MELMNFIFRLGVLFAIYGFLWGIFEIGLALLTVGRKKTLAEEYVVKAVKYGFLADVTFLFCLDLEDGQLSYYHLAIAGLVLLTYFVGRLQNKQNQQLMFKMMGNGLPLNTGNFNLKAEISVIVVALLIFGTLVIIPDAAKNPLSIWFQDSILNIEDTPVIGFIFKVIGFFFLVNMLMKMFNGFMYLLSGAPFTRTTSSFHTEVRKDDDFDDFEEIK